MATIITRGKRMKVDKIDNLVVWVNCRVCRSELDLETDSLKLRAVATVSYTPKAIGQAITDHKLYPSAWIIVQGNKELWLAPKVRGGLARKC